MSLSLENRINAFARLGLRIQSLTPEETDNFTGGARQENPWFTANSVIMALNGIAKLLDEQDLRRWTSTLTADPRSPRQIGVVMAGNIPLVGFHDFLSVLISGHRLKAKLSSQDSFLMRTISQLLTHFEPGFTDRIIWADRMDQIDAVIATGSDNTARYFEYYFRSVPRIIRKNRSSCAVLTGRESANELIALATDVFSYFGLGCRNVSKVYVPKGYDFGPLFRAWQIFSPVIDHHKYHNNYDYQKSILLVNRVPHLDNGFVLLKEDPLFVSPVSVLYYESYSSPEELTELVERQRDKIQCMVAGDGVYPDSVPFGQAQFPSVSEYADNVDTLLFLEEL